MRLDLPHMPVQGTPQCTSATYSSRYPPVMASADEYLLT